MQLLPLTCGTAALVLSSVAGASGAPPIAPPMKIVAGRADLSAAQAIAPVVTIKRDEIERSQASDVASLLSFVSGVSVARNGGPGQPASLFMRGANSDQTLVLLNGEPIKSGTLGRPPLRNIEVGDIERIEVIKGPRSSLYGSGAIGGVINIVTRRPEHPLHVDARARAGHYGTRAYDATVSGKADDFAGVVSLNHSSSDGFPTYLRSDLDRGHDNDTAALSGNWHGDNASISVRHWQSKGTTEYLLFQLTPVAQDYKNALSTAKLAVSPSEAWNSKLVVNHYEGNIDELDKPDFHTTHRNSADWRNHFALTNSNRLIVGVHFDHTNARALTSGTGYKTTFNSRAAYFQDDAVFGAHEVVLAARTTDDDRFGSHLTGNIDYGYQITDDTRVMAGYGTAFHAPDAADRYGFGGNPNLSPEKSHSTEIGLRHTFGPNQALNVNAYQNDVDGLIVYVDPDGFAGPAPGQLINVARARTRGLEVSYDADAGNWHWHAAATWMDPRNVTNDTYLARRARRSFKTRLGYRLGPHVLGLQLKAVGPRKDSGFSDITDAGYVVANLTSRFRLASHWSLFAKIENVLDTEYQEVAGYRTPGRGLYVTIKYQWSE